MLDVWNGQPEQVDARRAMAEDHAKIGTHETDEESVAVVECKTAIADVNGARRH